MTAAIPPTHAPPTHPPTPTTTSSKPPISNAVRVVCCRYASHRDKINTVVGVIAAGIGGTLMPVFTIFLGELVNALGDPTKDLMAELRR